MRSLKTISSLALATATVALGFAVPLAHAQDKVKVGLFAASSALPFYIAQERGYFKEANLDVEGVPLATHPLIVQSMVKGDIDAASNLLSLEALNINVLRPNTGFFISLNGQNAQYITEQFVVRPDSPAKELKDLKGMRILSAPGPGNMGMAKAVLKVIGLEEGRDYTMQEQQMSVHIGALKAGTFDAGYTLEPLGTMMIQQGVARRLEAGVVATHLVGRKGAFAHLAGGVVSGKFLQERPAVAERYARVWARAVNEANTDPSVRELLVKYMNTAASIAPSVPLVKYMMVRDLSPQDVEDFQKVADIAVQMGIVKSKIDVRPSLKSF
jgi:NitT/TauT family transport system substrate-binding protein